MIDPKSPDWPRHQAAAIIRARIADGTYSGQLPAQMQLAEELGVSPKTIEKVIAILKEEGLVFGVPGRGTFVSG
jgi:DNA-binding GntR family transcriptional regulator